MDWSGSEMSAIWCVSIDLNLILRRTRCELMLRWKLGHCLHKDSGWIPMQRNLRKRNLRQPIKSSQLPDSNLAYGSRDDLIGWRKLRYMVHIVYIFYIFLYLYICRGWAPIAHISNHIPCRSSGRHLVVVARLRRIFPKALTKSDH